MTAGGSMPYHYNLVDSPWIPCLELDGRLRVLSLSEALRQAGEIEAVVADSPLETGAIMRLLLAVLYAALRGPRNGAEWAELWRARSWDQPWMRDYLARWHDRFDLLATDYPIYQFPSWVVGAKEHPLSVLGLADASGNNPTLFDHRVDREGQPLTAAQAARALVTAQTFDLGGTAGPGRPTFHDAPWARGVIFVPQGHNLFESTCLALVRYDPQNGVPRPFGTSLKDRPAWEMEDPYQPERRVPIGYLDYLTWQSRKIRLIPEGDGQDPLVRAVRWAPGLTMSQDVIDPYKHYQRSSAGYRPLLWSQGRALWRDEASLLQFRGYDTDTTRPPAVLRWLADLEQREKIDLGHTLALTALGMASERGWRKVHFWRLEHLPLPTAYVTDERLVGDLTEALSFAEAVWRRLASAARKMADSLLGRSSQARKPALRDPAGSLLATWGVEEQFWAPLEREFYSLLQALPARGNDAVAAWEKAVERRAWEALGDAESQIRRDGRGLKASALGRSALASGLKELVRRID